MLFIQIPSQSKKRTMLEINNTIYVPALGGGCWPKPCTLVLEVRGGMEPAESEAGCELNEIDMLVVLEVDGCCRI